MTRRKRALTLVPMIVLVAIGTQLATFEALLALALHGQDAVHQHLENHPGHEHEHSHGPDEERRSHGYEVPAALHQPAAPGAFQVPQLLVTGGYLSLIATLVGRLDTRPQRCSAPGTGPPEDRRLRLRVLTLLAPNSPPRV